MFLEFKKIGYDVTDITSRALNSRRENKIAGTQRNVLDWILGLTGKLSQNLLRDSLGEELTQYADNLQESLSTEADALSDLSFEVKTKNHKGSIESIDLNGEDLITLMNIIGTQTLTIRGSKKSFWGKSFGDLVLGSVFQLLGFKLVRKNNIKKKPLVFFFLLEMKAHVNPMLPLFLVIKVFVLT